MPRPCQYWIIGDYWTLRRLAKSYWNTNALAGISWIICNLVSRNVYLDCRQEATQSIRRSCTISPLLNAIFQTYWHRKHSLTLSLITSINWDACEEAMGQLPFGHKRWLD
jgi:hypothetical protein